MGMFEDFLKKQLLELPAEPFFWPIAFFLPCLIIELALGRFKKRADRVVSIPWFWPVLAVVMLAGFVCTNWAILTTPAYTEQIQPQVASISWYFAEGHPLYHNANSPEGYSMLYGPYLYIITALFEKSFGPTILVSKLPSILAFCATLAVLVVVFRQRTTISLALLATSIFAALITCTSPSSFDLTLRSDSFLCFFVAIGLWASLSKWRAAPVLLGVAMGVCVNLKLHAVVYFLPLLWLAVRTGYGRTDFLLLFSSAVVLAALPFVGWPNVSLANYIWVLRGAATYGLDLNVFLHVLLWAGSAVFVVLAWAALNWLHDPNAVMEYLRAQRPLLGAMALSFLLVLVPASKSGSGSNHLWPWMITLIFVMVEIPVCRLPTSTNCPRWGLPMRAAFFSWLFSCLLSGFLACNLQSQAMDRLAQWAPSVEADLTGILQTQGKNYLLMMGQGDNTTYKFTKLRPYLVFAGQPIGFDPAALMDLQIAAIYHPDLHRLLVTMTAQNVGGKGLMWLIPKGVKPFSLISYYKTAGPLFDNEFRKDFAQMFQKSGSTQYFDLYTAKPEVSSAP